MSLYCFQNQLVLLCIQCIPSILWIGIPLPLQSQLFLIKVILCIWTCNRINSSYIRFVPGSNRLATLFSWGSLSNDRPVILPAHRLQMYDSARSIYILKMQKPVFPCLCINPGSLMRSIYLCILLHHDITILIRSPYILTAQNCLPALFHAASRSKDVIIAISLIHLGTFYCLLILHISIEDMLSFIYHM